MTHESPASVAFLRISRAVLPFRADSRVGEAKSFAGMTIRAAGLDVSNRGLWLVPGKHQAATMNPLINVAASVNNLAGIFSIFIAASLLAGFDRNIDEIPG